MGIDFTIIYPSFGMVLPNLGEEELRKAACRALNNLHADIFRPYADRMTPVAVIPMHTPQEAAAELDHAVKVLGFKAVLMPSFVVRPIPAVARRIPEAARHAYWFDTFALDSEYDYDPIWAKCLELKVVPTFHSGTMGLGMRNSISNFIYNHIGHFAASARGDLQGAVSGRCHAPFSGPEVCLSRRRRRMGQQPVVRPGGALGKAQCRDGGELRPAPLWTRT